MTGPKEPQAQNTLKIIINYFKKGLTLSAQNKQQSIKKKKKEQNTSCSSASKLPPDWAMQLSISK